MSWVADLIESFKNTSKVTSIHREKTRVNSLIADLIMLRQRYKKGLTQGASDDLQKAINYSIKAQKEIDEILDGAESAVERGEI